MAGRIEYADNAVYGNLAYDVSRVRGYAVPEEAYEIPAEEPRKEERVRVKEQAAVSTQAVHGISVFSVLGFVLFAILMVFVLLSYVQLAAISGENSKLANSISQLSSEQAQLKVKYETTFNLTEVEEYATNVLGMVKLSDGNSKVVSLKREDRAEILAEDDTAKGGVLSVVIDFLSSIPEYFE